MTKQFDLITETDARQLEYGTTVELRSGGRITPLAADTLRSRRITVVPGGTADPALPPDLAPVGDVRRVASASDHTGIALRRDLVRHLRGRGLAVDDLGVETTATVDYPDMAAAVAKAVVRREADAGIVIDGAGIGSAIAANKVRGIRAAMCTDETLARYSREHNGANVLTLGATLLPDASAALRIVDVWLATPMKEARYIRRLLKIRRLEDEPLDR
jgi:ribose 5-phosphate isomerase B